MRVLLHIGQSKTGTSAIQAFLTLNRETLAKNGILYPAINVSGMSLDLGAHNAVADALLGKSRFPHLSAEEYFEHFYAEAKKINATTLLLSGEHFFYGEPRIWDVANEDEYFSIYKKKLMKLSTFLVGHELEILIYLRPQLDWLSSAVGQTVRINGLISDKVLYENDQKFFHMMKPLLRYAKLIEYWNEILKPSDFKAIPYDRNTLYKNSSIADFLKRTGLDNIDFSHADENIQVNESLTREYIEVKKILNLTPKSKNSERVIIRCLEKLSALSDQTKQYALDPVTAKAVVEFSVSENQRLNELFGEENKLFKATSTKFKLDTKIPSPIEVNLAMEKFQLEYASWRAMVLRLNYSTRTFIRTKLPTLQAIIHNIKMSYLKVKFRN